MFQSLRRGRGCASRRPSIQKSQLQNALTVVRDDATSERNRIVFASSTFGLRGRLNPRA